MVFGLSAPALAQAPPQAGPVDDIQATLGIVLDRLDDLEAKIDNLPTDVDLSGVTQNWDKKLSGPERFTVLAAFNGEAVRDNETGLVWEQSPDPNPQDSWRDAIVNCANREVGGRKGWSLPMREQLASLVDTSNSDPALPTGHPFLNVQSAAYWSAATLADVSRDAWGVNFIGGTVFIFDKGFDSIHAWCVRGGQVYDGQDVNEVIRRIGETHP